MLHKYSKKFQQYLEILKIQKYRKSICKLRVSSHRFETITGRWAKPNKIPLENRLCKISNTLEDEFHFVLECALYKDLRKTYIKRYYWQRPNTPKFIELLSCENSRAIKNLSIFIDKAFKLREEVGII